jgi:hypothetical protein
MKHMKRNTESPLIYTTVLYTTDPSMPLNLFIPGGISVLCLVSSV